MDPIDENCLNPEHTFETFAVNAFNRFAHAASVAVAESPSTAYNPLFIYGGPGVGKTHLLHAIGRHATKLGSARVVRYLSAGQFNEDLDSSLRRGKIHTFRCRYRNVDLLLTDDIHLLANNERAQAEFFRTFNELYNANKQLVISSDRIPSRLHTVDDRLRARFEQGLLADIQRPDNGTRP